MSITKKVLTGAVAIYLLSGASAFAGGLNVELNVGQPGYVAAPVYAPPPPVYIAPTPAPWVEGYDPHHRYHDYRYWHDHHHDHDPRFDRR